MWPCSALQSHTEQSCIIYGAQDVPAGIRGGNPEGSLFPAEVPSFLALSHLIWLPDLGHPTHLPPLLDMLQVFNIPYSP